MSGAVTGPSQADRIETNQDNILTAINKVKSTQKWAVPTLIVNSAVTVVALVALGLSFVANGNSNQAQRSAGAIATARQQALIGSCVQDNKRIAQINSVVTAVETLLHQAYLASPTAARTPAQVAAAQAFVTQQTANLESARVPSRDCSLAGIARYFARPAG